RMAAEIVAAHAAGFDAERVNERAERDTERVHAHQVDLAAKEPARIVFAEAGGLHQRLRFVGVGIGLERGFRFGKHRESSTVSDIAQAAALGKRAGSSLTKAGWHHPGSGTSHICVTAS